MPPDYALYVEASRRFIALLREFAPVVEQYSIDEAWADLSGTEGLYGSPVAAAELLRTRIREELGFTVNIGISSNKLLAKMAGEFEKPDKVHTLFPEEVPQKLWPLPVRELFMLGPATERRLNRIGIHTIGELAQADPELLLHYLNKPGLHCGTRQTAGAARSCCRSRRRTRAMVIPQHCPPMSQRRQGRSACCCRSAKRSPCACGVTARRRGAFP